MFFQEEKVGDLTFAEAKSHEERRNLRRFFGKQYPKIAEDVFPDADFEKYFNSLILSVTDKNSNIQGGILSCAPPALAEEAIRTGSSAALKRIQRLTFLDLFVVNDEYERNSEVYSLLIDIYEQTSRANNIKTIVGFVPEDSMLATKLALHNFNVLKYGERIPSLQGIQWELPPALKNERVVWFYKNLLG